MLALTFTYFIVELIVGHLTQSIAMKSDAFHMLSDALALIIGLVSVVLSKRKHSTKNTFGWVRAEVLGALINSVFLISLCFEITMEAIGRLIEHADIERTDLLLGAACVGLAINVVGLLIFGHGHTHNVPHNAHEIEEEDAEIMDIYQHIDDTVNGTSSSQRDLARVVVDGAVSAEEKAFVKSPLFAAANEAVTFGATKAALEKPMKTMP